MQNKDILIISILTFITVLVWVFFDAYHVYTTSTIPADLKVQLEPLVVNTSLSDIKDISSRPEFLTIMTSPSAQLESLEVPETTPSAVTPTP